jgi:cytochrome c-type biogenesis protein CcmH
MGQFMLLAAILVCLAVAFAISALWQKSRTLALVLALALPLAAGALYWWKGTPAALDVANRTPPKTLPDAISQLERLTKADPKNYADQATLARAYMAAQQYDKASAAYASALALHDDTDLSVEYAEALLRSSPDRRFPPQAVQMLERALKANPQNQRALFFYGLHQRMSGQPAQAAETWQRLLSLLDPSTAIELRHQIGDARKEAGLPPIGPATATVAVNVSLDPTLARAARRGAVLYVFARKVGDAGPPVAVKRLDAEHFPVQLELGDGDSPMPTQTLSEQKQVVVSARLSQSGDALPASGDIEADSVTVSVADGAKVDIRLNRSVP